MSGRKAYDDGASFSSDNVKVGQWFGGGRQSHICMMRGKNLSTPATSKK